MSKFHEPQTALNGYTSMIRNMFLTSSIGFVAITFSNQFIKYQTHMQIMSLVIFTYSIIYGIKATFDFKEYLKYLNQVSNLPEVYKMQLDNWEQWIILTYLYIFILLIIILAILFRLVLM